MEHAQTNRAGRVARGGRVPLKAGEVRYMGSSVIWHKGDGSTRKALSDRHGRYAYRGDLKGQLGVLMANFGKFVAPGKLAQGGSHRSNRVSAETQRTRRLVMNTIVADLSRSGNRVGSLRGLKPKHIASLIDYWRREGIGAGTIGTRLAALRLLAFWIGKERIVGASENYLTAEEIRERGAPRPRAWETQGVDPESVIARFVDHEPECAWILLLAFSLGLRLKEAMLLDPRHRAGGVLEIWRGTKNGRLRTLPLGPAREALLARYEHFLGPRTSLVASEKTLASFRSRYYRQLRKHGVTRAGLGVTTHGLRHSYAQRLADELIERLGVASPQSSVGMRAAADLPGPETITKKGVVLSRLPVDIERIVSESLGHGRTEVTYTYMASGESGGG